MILAIIIPIRGIITVFFNLIFLKINIKRKLPVRAKKKERSIFTKGLAAGKIIKEKRIPNWAESMVPAVVGETNLFWLNCCMISPLILIPIPAKIRLIKRGILLNTIVLMAAFSSFRTSRKDTFLTPIKRDKSDNRIKITSR
jgi:hypothetical protein